MKSSLSSRRHVGNVAAVHHSELHNEVLRAGQGIGVSNHLEGDQGRAASGLVFGAELDARQLNGLRHSGLSMVCVAATKGARPADLSNRAGGAHGAYL